MEIRPNFYAGYSMNKNHNLYTDGTYMGLPVYQNRGPLVEEYLDRLWKVIQNSLSDHRRVFAIRFDLHFPSWMDASAENMDNQFIVRFMESFKAKIRHNRFQASQARQYPHACNPRFVWAREVGDDTHRVHYHVVLFLNRDVFFTLGHLSTRSANTYKRIVEAWSSALRLDGFDSVNLVHIPESPTYQLDMNLPEGIQRFFHRASYLCKADTKYFGLGYHGFGASRN